MIAIEPATPYLVMMDMDSTLIENEVIDDLAQAYGVGAAVRAITESAMRGELDFAQSLRKRVGLLAGADINILEQMKPQIRLTKGAREMIEIFRALGFKTCVVSGGFSEIVSDVAEILKIDNFVANTLEVAGTTLTGNLVGKIIDAQGKKVALGEMANFYNISKEHTIAIGDGANDIPMIQAAKIGIAFNAKPALASVADVVINDDSLLAVIDALGLSNP